MILGVIFSLLHGSLVHLEKEINDNSIQKIWEPSPKRKSLEYSWQRKKLHVVYMMIRETKGGSSLFLNCPHGKLDFGLAIYMCVIINSSSRKTLHGKNKETQPEKYVIWQRPTQEEEAKRNNQQRNQRRKEADWQRQIAGGGRGSSRSGCSYKLQNLVESRARRGFVLLIYILVPNKMMH
jgi:hypothetical protein